MTLEENLKIVFNKVYSNNKHIATIRFKQLIIKPIDLNKEELKYINSITLKLNLEIIKT